MSKRRRNADLPEAQWVVDYIDNMTPSDSFESEPMSLEQAEHQFAKLTENGTRNTSKDKYALSYYQLRQLRKE
jgi:hypothetical protein